MTTTLTPTSTDPTTEVNKIIQDVEEVSTVVASAAATVSAVSWWTALCGLCTALPGIVQLILAFMAWWKTVSDNNPQAFIADLGAAFQQLQNAKSPKDKSNAASAISGIIARLS